MLLFALILTTYLRDSVVALEMFAKTVTSGERPQHHAAPCPTVVPRLLMTAEGPPSRRVYLIIGKPINRGIAKLIDKPRLGATGWLRLVKHSTTRH